MVVVVVVVVVIAVVVVMLPPGIMGAVGLLVAELTAVAAVMGVVSSVTGGSSSVSSRSSSRSSSCSSSSITTIIPSSVALAVVFGGRVVVVVFFAVACVVFSVCAACAACSVCVFSEISVFFGAVLCSPLFSVPAAAVCPALSVFVTSAGFSLFASCASSVIAIVISGASVVSAVAPLLVPAEVCSSLLAQAASRTDAKRGKAIYLSFFINAPLKRTGAVKTPVGFVICDIIIPVRILVPVTYCCRHLCY